MMWKNEFNYVIFLCILIYPHRFESDIVWQEVSQSIDCPGFYGVAFFIHQDQILILLHQKPAHLGTFRLSVVDSHCIDVYC